ncbi:hypothetical protein C8T65DRAFT_234642 [Cerioporus squamosus]|nr:hypothetical protein C8T65DRAFT_234642 [Cerioporus squamosus]
MSVACFGLGRCLLRLQADLDLPRARKWHYARARSLLGLENRRLRLRRCRLLCSRRPFCVPSEAVAPVRCPMAVTSASKLDSQACFSTGGCLGFACLQRVSDGGFYACRAPRRVQSGGFRRTSATSHAVLRIL